MADYYTVSGDPAESSDIDSSVMRAELASVATGFTKVAGYTGNASKAVIINAGATAQTVTTGTLALAGNFATSGAFACTLTLTAATNVTLPTTGTLATLAGTESLSGKTLVSPTITTSPTAAGATWADLGSVTTVDINGGTIDGITDLAIVDGGTGSSTAAAARTALGLAIGTDVQAYDATLLSIAALGTAADKIAYTTGVDTWAEAAITAAGRAILDDATAVAQATTLGLGTGDSPQFTGIELGHATDTTLTRAAAGRVAIEGVGIVKGPASSTDNAAARFNLLTGELVQDSGVLIDDSNNITGVAGLTMSGTLTLAVQTANTVFAGPSSGASAAPAFRALVGAEASMVLLATGTVSSQATADITTGFSSTYDHYELVITDLKPVTDNTELWLRFSQDGGTNFLAGATAYTHTRSGSSDGGAVAAGSTGDSKILLAGGISGGADAPFFGVLEIYRPAGTDRHKTTIGRFGYELSAGANIEVQSMGFYETDTAAINAIRLMMSSGNISITYQLYGRRKS